MAELVAALKADARRSVIVLPDLHSEAAADLVLELVRLPHVRLIVESRSGSPAHQLLSRIDCAEMDLDLEQWRDRERFDRWFASAGERQDLVSCEPAVEGIDLSDPVAVCKGDPQAVTVGYERDGDDYGGLRSAWLRAGQALCREEAPATRALVLAAALGDSADPRLGPALAELGSDASWRLEWSRVCGDRTPPWPGPVIALSTGIGPLSGYLVVAGQQETVRIMSLDDASAYGRFVSPCGTPRSLAVLEDGTVLLLDGSGRVHVETGWVSRRSKTGLQSLLDEESSDGERVLLPLAPKPATAVAAVADGLGGFVVLGDAAGAVTSFGAAVTSAVLHKGPVTAVAGLQLALSGDERVSLVYSGGADGAVRAWSPGHSPMTEPVIRRPCPVVSLDARDTTQGPSLVVAWRDGAVDWIHPDTATRRTFRSGLSVRSVSLSADNRVVIGTDEAVVCLRPRLPSDEGGARTRPAGLA
ncbi:hypothetical protein LUX12_16455 [Streptomyces somaliensis]|uniref:hypothetical protein n=1 Tax=Streptomyces somaliensis TaxID=78355 RepID=UPI0020CD66EE|nr:hypothetical protein [Streptomyces somaliensis]MCP9946031.1 hypothetical protein [Streptomyces somaliensis]MCP9960800.1 hypothetical protein [Streptomyces somaliensis]MCP9973586.1 hypothetical protein [Streptomyces somaliensis]